MQSRRLRFAVLVIAGMLTGALLPGCALFPNEPQALKPPLIQPEKKHFVTADVKRGSLVKKVTGIGVLDPTTFEYYQFTQGGGRLAALNVKAGDRVKRSDVLVQVDTGADLDIELQQRQIDLAAKRLALEDARKTEDERHLEVRKMEVNLAQMLVDQTKRKIENSRLVARKDGVVTFATSLKPGDTVDSYRPVVITADPNDLRLAYEVNQGSDIQEVKLGMEAAVTYKGQSYKGVVVQTPASAPATSDPQLADRNSKTLFINLDKPLAGAEIGQTAEAFIVLAQRDNTLTIPIRAVHTSQGRKYVQVLENGDQLREVNIDTGLETSTDVEILQGLAEGQSVVLP